MSFRETQDNETKVTSHYWGYRELRFDELEHVGGGYDDGGGGSGDAGGDDGGSAGGGCGSGEGCTSSDSSSVSDSSAAIGMCSNDSTAAVSQGFAVAVCAVACMGMPACFSACVQAFTGSPAPAPAPMPGPPYTGSSADDGYFSGA